MQRFVQPLCLATFLAAAGLSGATTARAQPDVVATVPALHAIASGVLGDTASPHLLIPGGASPHSYSLKPSNAQSLHDADLVIWAGPQVETFLEDKLSVLAPGATVITMTGLDGVVLHHVREGGLWDAHSHDHGHDDAHDHADEHDHDAHDHADEHDHDEHDRDTHEHDAHGHEAGHDHEIDGHVWLDPRNAIALSAAIADALAKLDPANADGYRARHEAQAAKLEALDEEIAARLAPVRERPYIVFHDAYQYFETRYGMAGAGSVTVSPEVAPGAKRVREIHDRIKDRGAVCVFAEPQFRPAILDAVTEGTAARTAVLDPLGASLTPGAALYPALLRGLADGMVGCLAAAD